MDLNDFVTLCLTWQSRSAPVVAGTTHHDDPRRIRLYRWHSWSGIWTRQSSLIIPSVSAFEPRADCISGIYSTFSATLFIFPSPSTYSRKPSPTPANHSTKQSAKLLLWTTFSLIFLENFRSLVMWLGFRFRWHPTPEQAPGSFLVVVFFTSSTFIPRSRSSGQSSHKWSCFQLLFLCVAR